MIRHKSQLLTWMLFFLITISISACGNQNPVPFGKDNSAGVVAVDRIFREFYQSLGGEKILGYPIQEIFDWNNSQCQYTEAVLMCFNPLATSENRFSLYPVANNFDFSISAETPGFSDGENPIVVYAEFLPLYEQINKNQNTGKPLTKIRYNPIEKRIEQYFENVGFYRSFDSLYGDVKLMAYGVYACGDQCQFQPRSGSSVSNLTQNIELPFLPVIAHMNSPFDFGEPLTRPFITEENKTMQVYENVILFGYPEDPKSVHLLDLSRRMGFKTGEPGAQYLDLSQHVVFYNVDGPNGFHVPMEFDEFIVNHGGREFSGNPLAEYDFFGNNVRQCFENYCLDYVPSEPQGKKVKMVSLGAQYLKQLNLSKALLVHPIYTADTISLQINEQSAVIAPDQDQIIEINVLSTEDQQPIPHMEGSIEITLPQGDRRQFGFEPTNRDGNTTIKIPAQNQVANGKIIPYSICLNLLTENLPFCVQDSYLIWQTP